MKHQFEHILGQSNGLSILYRAEQVAPMNTTVLILGETVRERSDRRRHPQT